MSGFSTPRYRPSSKATPSPPLSPPRADVSSFLRVATWQVQTVLLEQAARTVHSPLAPLAATAAPVGGATDATAAILSVETSTNGGLEAGLAGSGGSLSSLDAAPPPTTPRTRDFTFTEGGALGLTMRNHAGRALIYQVSGQAHALGVPPNCTLISVDGRPLLGDYRDVVATIATMPRPFVLNVQLPEGAVTPEELERKVLSDALVLLAAGGNDRRVGHHCAGLRGKIGFADVGLSPDVAGRCSPHAFDAAAELLSTLPLHVGPQAKLRLMLRAWDCVLGVLGLCTDSPSADDFLPGMACALLHACPPMLISAVNSLVNFSAREDYEDMWVFHFVAAVGLVAQLPPPDGQTPPLAAPPADEPARDDASLGGSDLGDGFGRGPESVWTEVDEPAPSEVPTAKEGRKRTSTARGAGRFLSGLPGALSRPTRSSADKAGAGGGLLPAAQHQALSSVSLPSTLPASVPASPNAPQNQPLPASVPASPQAQPQPTAPLPSPSLSQPASQPPHPSPLSPEQRDAALAQILEMGFDTDQAERAFALGGSPAVALQLLLDGAVPSADDAPAPTQDVLGGLPGFDTIPPPVDIGDAVASAPPPALPTPAAPMPSPAQSPATTGLAATPPAPAASGRIFQAACPRCQAPCRFQVPADTGQQRTKLKVLCQSCEKPFAIQV